MTKSELPQASSLHSLSIAIFNHADCDPDGQLTLEELVSWIGINMELMEVLERYAEPVMHRNRSVDNDRAPPKRR